MQSRAIAGTRHVAALVLAILVSTIAVQLVDASEAAAHTRLVSSSPPRGATLDRLPEMVTLTFSEAVTPPAALNLARPDGALLSTGKVTVDKATVSRPLVTTGELPAGTYTISYQVTSTDGHPLSGTVSFTLSPPGETPTTAPPIGENPANSKLASSLPDDGSEVVRLPEVAVLNFNEVIRQPAEVTVTGPDGTQFSTDEISVVDATLLCPLTPAAVPAAGAYTMSYRARSSKGQPLNGTVRFTLSPGPAVPAAVAVPPTEGPGAEQSHRPIAVVALVAGLVAALGVALLDVRRLVRDGFPG